MLKVLLKFQSVEVATLIEAQIQAQRLDEVSVLLEVLEYARHGVADVLPELGLGY